MVRDVSTKIGPLRDVLMTLCAGWEASSNKSECRQNIVSPCDNFKRTYSGFPFNTYNKLYKLSINTYINFQSIQEKRTTQEFLGASFTCRFILSYGPVRLNVLNRKLNSYA